MAAQQLRFVVLYCIKYRPCSRGDLYSTRRKGKYLFNIKSTIRKNDLFFKFPRSPSLLLKDLPNMNKIIFSSNFSPSYEYSQEPSLIPGIQSFWKTLSYKFASLAFIKFSYNNYVWFCYLETTGGSVQPTRSISRLPTFLATK